MLRVVIAINIALYVLMFASTGETSWRASTLLAWGGNLGDETFHGQLWRLFTAMYLHASPQHILGNMALLAITGKYVESRIGAIPAVLAYTITGLVSEFASAWGHPHIVSVGASGAIAGIVGVLVTLWASGRYPDIDGKWLGNLIAINALYSLAPSVDWLAHIGGFVSGLACGGVLLAFTSARQSAPGG